MIKIGFIVWNSFQLIQFKNVYDYFSEKRSTIIIIDRGANMRHFDFHQYDKEKLNYVVIKQKHLLKIDGVYDILFFQSAFPRIEEFNKSKLVALQYGLAKERHNYGEWRALADMNLMYGNYSREKVQHFSPSYAVGNPKFQHWHHLVNNKEKVQLITKKLNLDKSKKTILYMPTWGDLGSSDVLLEPLAKLKNRYNLIFKMHHNNDLRYPVWKEKAIEYGIDKIYDGASDQLKLLAVSDMVISDFSGAIFDALLVNKPILLFQEDISRKIGVQKFDLNSLEYKKRDSIGLVCSDISNLDKDIEYCLKHSPEIVATGNLLRNELFLNPDRENNSCELIAKYIELLYEGEIPNLNEAQLCVRETVQELRRCRIRNKKRINKKKISFKRFIFN